MTQITRGYVGGPGEQVHFRRAGEIGELVVLLHQTASSSRMYEPLIPFLAEHFRVVAFDTPGFGASCRLADDRQIGEYVDRLRLAAMELSSANNIHLVGHHTGAVIASDWALRFPGEVDSVTAIGALAMGEARRSYRAAHIPTVGIGAKGEQLEAAWKRVTGVDYPGHVDSALWHREATDTLIATPHWTRTYEAVFDFDFDSAWAQLTMPAQTICGNKDIEAANLPRVRAIRPDLPVYELDGGTFVVEERPVEVAQRIGELVMSINRGY